MRRLLVILLPLLLMVGLVVLVYAQETQNPPLIPPDQTILADMYARINALREERGLPPYRLNDLLNRAAQDQAEFLARTGYRGHFRPDGSRPSTRAAAFGFVTSHWCCGENYYMSIDATPDMVYDFWHWSPSHFSNMVHRNFTDIGLGMSSNGYRISYVTVFAEADDLHPPDAGVAQNVPVVEQSVPTSQESALPAEVSGVPASGEYIVLPGDTLARIAGRYHTTVQALATTNNIVDPEIIYPGQQLLLSGAPEQIAEEALSAAPTTVEQALEVTPVAEQEVLPPVDTGSESEMAVAPASDSETEAESVPPEVQEVPPPVDTGSGSEMAVVPASDSESGDESVHQELSEGEYVVLAGDTLGRIASRFHTTVETLARVNNIADPDIIYAEQRLIVPSTAPQITVDSEPVTILEEVPSADTTESAQTHVVLEGETLARIATEYGASVQAIAAANNIVDPTRIYAGQVLIIPVAS